MVLMIRWPEGPVSMIRRPRDRGRYDTGSGLGLLTGLHTRGNDPGIKHLPESDVGYRREGIDLGAAVIVRCVDTGRHRYRPVSILVALDVDRRWRWREREARHDPRACRRAIRRIHQASPSAMAAGIVTTPTP